MKKKKTAAAAAVTAAMLAFCSLGVGAQSPKAPAFSGRFMAQYQSRVDSAYNRFVKDCKSKKEQLRDPKAPQTAHAMSTVTTADSFGTYPTRPGVILVSSDFAILWDHVGHAGMVYSAGTTVESQINGVQYFENDWQTRYNNVEAATVTTTTADQDKQAVLWCASQIGKPYNFNYLNTSTRSKFYCSQLVWASFNDLFGINIDQKTSVPGMIVPVDLVNQSNVEVIYQK